MMFLFSAPFAVIAMTVASQEEIFLLTLFSFCGESGTTVSDVTHLSGRFSDWESILGFVLSVKRIHLCLKKMKMRIIRF